MTPQEEFYKAIENIEYLDELQKLDMKFLANTYANSEWHNGYKQCSNVWSKLKKIL